ncbi:c-type cytochrome [Devosia neptuniae]|uniref:C-type cytochrome n=1 Tax=Devosia neptuniae TaxID=191302 RepID=A0ABY6CEQ6_9HYPH|nr:c-type cytochrome [Devosia neptuniae]UXN70732.1 c-type cytochrome [Devosia neptuniae]
MPFRSKRITAPVALFALAASVLSAGSAMAAGFTAEQATAGKTAFDSNCAQCHGFQLEGPDAPGLAGRDVMQNWDTAGGLYDFISVAMPPSAPGLLGEETYVNIVAYIMQFNGAAPGDTPLATGDAMYEVSLATETAAGAASMAAAAADAGGAAAPADAAAAPAVPQAFTWGKQLPGGLAPADMAPTADAAAPTVPQAYTWGKTLPTAGN